MIRWTEEEIQYIKENYGKIKSIDIAKQLGKKQQQVNTKARNLGLISKLKRSYGSFRERILYTGILPIDDIKTLTTKKKAKFKCKYCGDIFETLPQKIASGHTKSCGCVSIGKRLGTQSVSSTHFSSIKNGARARNIEFNITINYIEELLIKQNFKCALSGRQLVFGYSKDKITSSLDRIDSSKGYIEGNVQWVHSEVNICKQRLTQEQFISMCNEIANNTRYL